MTRSATALVFCTLLLGSTRGVPAAGTVEVHQSLVGHGAGGSPRTIRVEVRNLITNGLQNVDLRPATPDRISLVKGVLQFGGIPAREARSATGEIIIRSDKGPLVWRVDFDGADGHHQEVIQGISLGE